MDIHLFESKTLQLPSPIQELNLSLFKEANVRVYVKRDDLIHPIISGNKWRKLREYIRLAKEFPQLPLVSFGGAYSNHLYALAYIGHEFKIPTMGIIRGKELNKSSNPFLEQMFNWGMELHFISREDYKEKISPIKRDSILIPEGGYSEIGINGIQNLVSELENFNPSHIVTAVGTGTTALGIHKYWKKPVIGILTLNNLAEIKQHEEESNSSGITWKTDYIMGKYAKETPILNGFCQSFEEQHQIKIEPIYTGRMFYGLYDMIAKKAFPEGSTILAIHTGGIKLPN
jgi:1-aminocyclopropane-1-carboxylate deaminase